MASRMYEEWEVAIKVEEEKSVFKSRLINQIKHLRQFNLTRNNETKVIRLEEAIEEIERCE